MAKKQRYEIGLVQRIEECLEGQSHSAVSKVTGENAESIRRWRISGKAPVRFLAKIAAHYDVNVTWLLTGKGPMLKRDETKVILRNLSTEELLSELAKRIERPNTFLDGMRAKDVRVLKHPVGNGRVTPARLKSDTAD